MSFARVKSVKAEFIIEYDTSIPNNCSCVYVYMSTYYKNTNIIINECQQYRELWDIEVI
jgi:hypothetical protein